MKKAITAWILMLVIVFSGCTAAPSRTSSDNSELSSSASDKDKTEEKEEKEKTVSLACSITDSFCPYTAVTLINREMSSLLYDSLITLDNTFAPEKSLAEDIKTDGKTVTVTLKSVTFSDGSYLSADDVVYCAEKAMDSSTKYKDNLEDVTSVSAASSTKVVFSLSKADPYFENQLDFPIYKKNSDKKSSSDNIEIPPIGCGMYIINDDKTELIANPQYHGGAPKVKTIKLINTPDSDALQHNLEVGNITCYYSDLSGCELPQVRGGYEKVNLNNLVYLGANMKSGLMSYTDMRKAVSAALDRDDIVENAYYQNAVSATGVFNPSWCEKDSAIQSNENVANENVYLALLGKIGYNKKDSSGYYINSEGERLTLSLVYYEGNPWRSAAAKLIKTHMRSAGIKIELKKLGWSDYKSYLEKGYFDLYLAEIKLGNNMDISQLVTKSGSAAYGVYYKNTSSKESTAASQSSSSSDYSSQSGVTSSDSASSDNSTVSSTSSDSSENPTEYAGETAKAVEKFYSEDATLSEVAAAFATELPVIPICYRTGILCYTTDISGISPSVSDVYRGIGNTTIS